MNIRKRLCACAADRPSSGFRDMRRSIGMRVRREYSHGRGNFSFRKRVHPFPVAPLVLTHYLLVRRRNICFISYRFKLVFYCCWSLLCGISISPRHYYDISFDVFVYEYGTYVVTTTSTFR